MDLRVLSSGRSYIVVGAIVLAGFSGWRTLAHYVSSGSGSAPLLGLTVFFSLLALWCALGDERWHVEQNCLVHRVGIGRWRYSRRFQDADLQIVARHSTDFNVPYYRLYAIANGRRHFLIERSENESQQLAKFISSHTGWRILPETSPSLEY